MRVWGLKQQGGRLAVLLLAILLCALVACSPAQPQNSESGGVFSPSASGVVSSAQPVQGAPAMGQALPQGFVYVADVVPDVLLEIRYYSTYNFVGQRIDGYEAPVAIMTVEAAEALGQAARALAGQGYRIKIFDAYRPTTAVEHFVRWAQTDDEQMKPYFFPDVEKGQLFELGYVATQSGHSRGSTVDLTLVDMSTGQELDMGTPFDFFGQESHFGTSLITEEQAANREILKNAMTSAGFVFFSGEWWHYLLANEPYPDTYFDFPVL